jgi:hypothetical protein
MNSREQQAEELLREFQEREQRIRSILETALDAVVTMNPAGQITGWNPEAERIFAWSSAGLDRKQSAGGCPTPSSLHSIGKRTSGVFKGFSTQARDCC